MIILQDLETLLKFSTITTMNYSLKLKWKLICLGDSES